MFDITNYTDHPSRPGYTIFKFYKKERAQYFEKLLKKENIWFESSINEDDKTIFLFGIKKGDFKIAMNANYLVSGKFRNKIIPNVYFRWTIIIIAISLITLAIIGAIINR
jgi:hypothetical protein